MKPRKYFLLFFLFALVVPSLVLRAEEAEITAQEKAKIKETAQIVDNYEQWKGFGFGLAYGMSFPLKRIIEGYEIVNDIVRVTNERSAVQNVLLESHYFIPIRRPAETLYRETLKKLDKEIKDRGVPTVADNNYIRAEEAYEEIRALRGVGVGPFVCIIPGTDKFLKALGFGIMVGLRRGETSNSFNIGIGYINYSDMPTLVDEVKVNSPLPKNYSNPIKIGNIGGVLVLFSFSF